MTDETKDAGGAGMSRHDGRKSTEWVIAADAGGTFTDLLLLEDGALRVLKVRSTPEDPSRAVLEGVARLLEGRGERPPLLLIHGTTVATNAVLEGRGARVGLVTNRGFEGVLEIGRQNRPQLYALVGHRSPPLVDRKDRVGIAGRLGPDGDEIDPLDPEEVSELPRRLGDVDSVAISLLHAYADPRHEEAVARELESLEAQGIPVTVSSRILPEFREFERTSTAVVNAFVAPRMDRYLGRLAESDGVREVRIMGSAGGALPLDRARAEPVRTVLSGPAGGVAGALEQGRRVGRTHLLSFDMGGTSTDVSLIPGRLLTTREGEIGSRPVAIPLMDIHTVGAGGGSIARVDPGGALRVGPESAGADPGPICYGRGGTQVTVTDANLWLGRLRPEGFLGGTATLDHDAIGPHLEALASDLGTDADRAAEGVLEVANATMERALRLISVERGIDPAGYSILSFGGAGGLHAADLAGRLGARSVLVPPDPGVQSAWGMLAAPVVRDRTRTLLLSSDEEGAGARVEEAARELETLARRELEAVQGLEGPLETTLRLDARYRGQSWELEVPVEGWLEAFHREHEVRYGYRREGTPVEAVTLRVRASVPGLHPPSAARPDGHSSPDTPETAGIRYGGEDVEARILWRDRLGGGEFTLEGPLLVLEYSSTLWVPPGWTLTRLEGGMLEMEAPDGG
jgi:N-methylhydantoinase A